MVLFMGGREDACGVSVRGECSLDLGAGRGTMCSRVKARVYGVWFMYGVLT